MEAYAELLEEEGIEIPAWFSFSCKDGSKVVSGDYISECASIADSCERVATIGVNCTAPRYIHSLIESITKVRDSPNLVMSCGLYQNRSRVCCVTCVNLSGNI